MIVDISAVARPADPARVREWLAGQRVFISSALADTAAERRTLADAIEEEGARPVWFEEFGRDADPEESYLSEVDSSTIYVGIANEIYGRLNSPGFSATEAEYMRAREAGKRVFVLVAGSAPQREGHLSRFIERVRVYVTTEDYADAADAGRRVRRRLHELAAEALSPWVKLGDLVFRADEIDDRGDAVTLRARASDDIAYRLEQIRDQRFGRARIRFVHRNRVGEAELTTVRRTTHAGGADALTVELAQFRPAEVDAFRGGAQGISAEDLVEHGMRALFLGEALPERLGILGSMADTGIDLRDLGEAFDLPNESAPSVTRLVVADGLIGTGRAGRITAFELGPRMGDQRCVTITWEEATPYANTAPGRRAIEGAWRRPSAMDG